MLSHAFGAHDFGIQRQRHAVGRHINNETFTTRAKSSSSTMLSMIQLLFLMPDDNPMPFLGARPWCPSTRMGAFSIPPKPRRLANICVSSKMIPPAAAAAATDVDALVVVTLALEEMTPILCQ
jgi:hypothetical protein